MIPTVLPALLNSTLSSFLLLVSLAHHKKTVGFQTVLSYLLQETLRNKRNPQLSQLITTAGLLNFWQTLFSLPTVSHCLYEWSHLSVLLKPSLFSPVCSLLAVFFLYPLTHLPVLWTPTTSHHSFLLGYSLNPPRSQSSLDSYAQCWTREQFLYTHRIFHLSLF